MKNYSTRAGIVLGLCSVLNTTPAWADPCLVEGISGEQALRIIRQLRSDEFRDLVASADIQLDALNAFGPDHTPSPTEIQTLFEPGGPLSFRRIMRFRRNLWRSRIAPLSGSVERRSDVAAGRALAATFPVLQSLGDLPECRSGSVNFPRGVFATGERAATAASDSSSSDASRVDAGAATSTTASRGRETRTTPPMVADSASSPEALAEGTHPSGSTPSDALCHLSGGPNAAAILAMLGSSVTSSLRALRDRLGFVNTRLVERAEGSSHPYRFLESESLESLPTDRFLARRATFVQVQERVLRHGCHMLTGRSLNICRAYLASGRVPYIFRRLEAYEGSEEVPESVVSQTDRELLNLEEIVLESELPNIYRSCTAQIAYMDTISRARRVDRAITSLDGFIEGLQRGRITPGGYLAAQRTIDDILNTYCGSARVSGSYTSSYSGESRRLVEEMASRCRTQVPPFFQALGNAYPHSICHAGESGGAGAASAPEGASSAE